VNQAKVEHVEESYLTKPLVTETTITLEEKPKIKGNHQFPWGYCTYWVSTKRDIPWSGNANQWLTNAPKYGFETGSEPQVGAIVQTNENPILGHVAYVESVGEHSITVSEMNYLGWGFASTRTLNQDSPVIKGYIYE